MDEVVKKLESLGKSDPRIVRLRTIPGVGPRTAEILVACIDDPHRFHNGRQVSAYFGLVPRQYQSGETDRNGRITKRGNPLARTILTECAWASLRYNAWFKAVYERVIGKQKTRKKKAAIALARKIAVVAWAMLRDEKDWDPSTMLTTTRMFNGGDITSQEETLNAMQPKENSDQRKSRLRRQAKEANLSSATNEKLKPKAANKTTATKSNSPKTTTGPKSPVRNKPSPTRSTTKTTAKTTSTRRARKPVSAG